MIDITYDIALPYQRSMALTATPKKPLVTVRLLNGGKGLDTNALVDTGADYSVFDADLAEPLGLELTRGKRVNCEGLDGNTLPAYEHTIWIKLLDAPPSWKAIKARVVFRENHPSRVGNLLGRIDFFAALLIGFDEKEQKLYIGRKR
jgi:hypothetical protein